MFDYPYESAFFVFPTYFLFVDLVLHFPPNFMTFGGGGGEVKKITHPDSLSFHEREIYVYQIKRF